MSFAGITILRKTETIPNSEKWFVPRQNAQLLPSGLICRDLKTLPVVEVTSKPNRGIRVIVVRCSYSGHSDYMKL